MTLPNQFVTWTFVEKPGQAKPAKVPCDPITGAPIDPHDPAN